MTIHEDFIALTEWTLRMQDLRHSYIRAENACEVMRSPGLEWALETSITLAIYEAALGKSYKHQKTIAYEQPYPNSKKNQNPPRADLAIKKDGRGQNWSYIEVKYWNPEAIRRDIKKLKKIKKRAQRWILTYRLRKDSNRVQTLEVLLQKNFSKNITPKSLKYFSFKSSLRQHPKEAVCEAVFWRVK